jgi:hypothetical protein
MKRARLKFRPSQHCLQQPFQGLVDEIASITKLLYFVEFVAFKKADKGSGEP